MKAARRPMFSGAVVALLTVVSAARGSGQAGGVDRALLEQVAAAWSTMDVAQVAPFYAKDADLVFYDVSPLKYTSWEAYARGEAETFKTLTSTSLKLTADTQIHNSGNLAWTSAIPEVEMITKDGRRMLMHPRWSTVWEKRGGKWLIVHEHFSMALTDMQPPNGNR